MPEAIEYDDLRLGDEILLIASEGSLSTVRGTVTRVVKDEIGDFVELSNDFIFDSVDDHYLIVLVARPETAPVVKQYPEGALVRATVAGLQVSSERIYVADGEGNFVSPRTREAYEQSLLKVTEVLWEGP